MTKVEAFYDKFEQRLLADFLNDNRRVTAALDFVLKYLHQTEVHSILDLGCGIGWSAFEVSRAFPEKRVVGMDLSGALIKTAQTVFSAPHLQFIKGDIGQGFHDAGAPFDAIVMIDVFEHIAAGSRSRFYKDLSAVLTGRFSLLLTCPTKHHQHFLRTNQPEGLQPIDEEVDAAVLQEFAAALNAELVYFAHQNIWQTNDYFHAVISNHIPYQPKAKPAPQHHLMHRNEKMELLRQKGIAVPSGISPQVPSLLQKLINRLK